MSNGCPLGFRYLVFHIQRCYSPPFQRWIFPQISAPFRRSFSLIFSDSHTHTSLIQPPTHKKPRQSYSWEGKSSKVCIPLFCYGRTIHDREWNICVVDLSACEEETHDFSLSPPTFNIKFVPDADCVRREPGSVREGFCALGNRVYIFESCVYNDRKAVYYIDISNPLEFASQTLLITDLPKIGEMRSAKYNPNPLVVPNTSKILVFPDEVVHKGIPMTNIIGGFELFDTVDGSFLELPSIDVTVPIRGCHIEAYGFIDTAITKSDFSRKLTLSKARCRLSVQIPVGQIYVLDLDSLDKGWVPTANPLWLDHLAADSCTSSTSFDVVETQACFRTCGGIRDLHVQVEVGKEVEEHDPYYLWVHEPYYLWVLSKVIPDINDPECFLTLLNHDEQAGESCICRLAVETSERECPKKSICMQFDVAVLDLKRYKQELELPENSTTDYTRSVKSLRYSLNLPGDVPTPTACAISLSFHIQHHGTKRIGCIFALIVITWLFLISGFGIKRKRIQSNA